MNWPDEAEEARMNNIVLNGNTGEHYDLVVQRRLDKVYQNQLFRNPSCLDPEHPGCDKCWDNHDD
jgi:hypothetical protein